MINVLLNKLSRKTYPPPLLLCNLLPFCTLSRPSKPFPPLLHRSISLKIMCARAFRIEHDVTSGFLLGRILLNFEPFAK
jgi:hypothetical protein